MNEATGGRHRGDRTGAKNEASEGNDQRCQAPPLMAANTELRLTVVCCYEDHCRPLTP